MLEHKVTNGHCTFYIIERNYLCLLGYNGMKYTILDLLILSGRVIKSHYSITFNY